MKKKLLLFLFCLVPLLSKAQIYTKIQYNDKFDDIIKTEDKKTLINETDTTFVFETKGQKPQLFWKLIRLEPRCIGDPKINNHERLTDKEVYGWQECYCVVKYEDKDKYYSDWYESIRNDEEASDITKKCEKYWLFIIHRVISRYSFEFSYDSEFVWIQNETPEDGRLGEDINRIIYTRE